MFILFEGPEKAGKSTIIAMFQKMLKSRGFTSTVRKWGQIDPDDSVYSPYLLLDCNRDQDSVVLWDRGWISEYVYATLLHRPRRLKDNPWLAEWLHGRIAQTHGLVVVLLGSSAKHNQDLRDNTDLPVNPWSERALFSDYANRFGLMCFKNEHTEEAAWEVCKTVFKAFMEKRAQDYGFEYRLDAYAGKLGANVVFMQDRKSDKYGKITDSWLPFNTTYAMKFAREFLGDDAFKCGWGYTRSIRPEKLRYSELVVCCDKPTTEWVRFYARADMSLLPLNTISIPPLHQYYRGAKHTSTHAFAAGYAQMIKTYLP